MVSDPPGLKGEASVTPWFARWGLVGREGSVHGEMVAQYVIPMEQQVDASGSPELFLDEYKKKKTRQGLAKLN